MFNQASNGEVIYEESIISRVRASNPGLMTGSGTNTYIVFQNNEALVIDPGPDMSDHVDNIIACAGDVKNITKILLTHMHPDHSPASIALKKLSGADIYGIPPDPLDEHQDHSVDIDVQLTDGQIIPFGHVEIETILTPGHTDNHACFLLKEEGVVFTGDHIMQGSTVVIIPPYGNMKDYLLSLAKLKSYDIKSIAPGHGEIIFNPIDEVDRLINHRLKREEMAVESLKKLRRSSLSALTEDVYQDVDVSLHQWAALSLSAHLLKLKDEGRVNEIKGIWSVKENSE